MANGRVGVLFVCLGNICRSPMARHVFQQMVSRHGAAARFDIDSCGTGPWHAGQRADERTYACLARHGETLEHTARVLDAAADVKRFEWFIAMDRSNAATLAKRGVPRERIRLLLDCADPGEIAAAGWSGNEVPDPYEGATREFDLAYRLILAGCKGLWQEVE